jgi:hypothetical protein
MYDPVRVPRTITRRGTVLTLLVLVASLIAIVVTVVRTMPHSPPPEPVSLDELGMMLIPDAAQTAVVAAMVRAALDHPSAAPTAAPLPPAAPCVASTTAHPWDGPQRANATTIVQVGVALSIPLRGEIVAVATAMQESQLRNLGDLGAHNDHDSLGLFQQRPSMGWGSAAQVTDPIFSATAFYLALKRVPRWESLAVTVAAQKVQRSAYPNRYAQWEGDATMLVQDALCNAR